ncbi:hypothetical protein FA15DRAFT_664441 [Coprinopsis marcescibilis]|uniref:Nudix hydrolase domain-containing protein n=1 Tax=Coprinopsis marcescibilis TaxID=230819 RepID=A0A5C3LAS3_COPMA|nr:hypothetical protein FA15DRAFT_664441 [Coprinopsis marcescibilis]
MMNNPSESLNRVLSQHQNQTAQSSSIQTHQQRPDRHLPPPLSKWSTPAVEDSAWCAQNFTLGVGMVLIQNVTHKVVLVSRRGSQRFFFPRGRKDRGETLEVAALREAYEESGYKAELLPHFGFTSAPLSPHSSKAGPSCEAVYLTIVGWGPVRGQTEGEYLVHWYLGWIPEHAVPEQGTGMPDEMDYESQLFTIEEALQRMHGQELLVLKYAWAIYCETMGMCQEIEERRDSLANEANQDVDLSGVNPARAESGSKQ